MNRITELADKNGAKVIKGTTVAHDQGAVFTVETLWHVRDLYVEDGYIMASRGPCMIGGYTSDGGWCSLPVDECEILHGPGTM